jgi:hypothetical protein
MTIIEMHSLCDLLIDKANAPWFSSKEKDDFINLAQAEYVDKNYRFFEKDEEIRAKLNNIVRSVALGTTQQVLLSAITDFRYALRLKGTAPNKCGRLISQPIAPVQWDDEAENQLDPFNKATDENMGYTQENVVGIGNVFNILSDTIPTLVSLVYLKTPIDVFNDTVTPANNVNCELSESTHEEIVNLAVRKMLGTVENQTQYQVQANEIVSQNQGQ